MTNQTYPHEPSLSDEFTFALFREHLQFVTKGGDTDGIEIMALTKMVSNMIALCFTQSDPTSELTPARWGLLMRLLEEEQKGNLEGITPTHMSQTRNVKKNTISSVLRGMEDQGLIERTLDPVDRRIFRIRLTGKGRRIVEETSPQRVRMLNKLVSQLEPGDRVMLIALLEKLIRSVVTNGNLPPFPPPMD
jgi:DNA-binding MarR family transcriptional regulator